MLLGYSQYHLVVAGGYVVDALGESQVTQKKKVSVTLLNLHFHNLNIPKTDFISGSCNIEIKE